MKKIITSTKTRYYYDKGDVIKYINTGEEFIVDKIIIEDGKTLLVTDMSQIFVLTPSYKPTESTIAKCEIIDRSKPKKMLSCKRERGFEIISESQFMNDTKCYSMELVDIIQPKRGTKKSACYDFFAPFEITLASGEYITIPTGIKSYMLDDEVCKAYPRSGHGFKFFVKIANTVGIIDADYYNNPKNEGHIFIKIRNEGEKPLIIPKGEGFCQLMFQKYLLADGDSFDNGEDRDGGIGSTNKKV